MAPDPKIGIGDIDTAPISTDTPERPSDPETYAKLWDQFTNVSNEKVEIESDLERLKSIAATNAILDGLIEPYASKAFAFMYIYCGFVGFMLVEYLLGHALPEKVLVVLVGSTAVTVIGLVGMVLTGIFVGARHRLK
jgi:hypothetical protein